MFYNPAKTQYFKEMVLTITGQPFEAARYVLEDDLLSQQRGLLRFQKTRSDGTLLRVSWQLLAFEQSPIARFRLELARLNAGEATIEKTLSAVIWHDYQARVLPSEDFWWEFRTGDELPYAIASAGKLLFAYGIPWLEPQPT